MKEVKVLLELGFGAVFKKIGEERVRIQLLYFALINIVDDLGVEASE